MSENPGTTNQATAVSGSVGTVNFNAPVTVIAGDNVSNSVQSAAGTKGQDSELQSGLRIDGLVKDLHSNTKAKSNFEITGNFPTLSEPTSQFSPQMTKSNNYFGGGKGEAISYEEFLQEIMKGESTRIALLGSAGFGKTVQLKKLAQILLENKDRNQDQPDEQHFKLIHWIDLKSLQNEETTLQELLFDDLDLSENDMEYLLDWIKRNQSHTIFLFDGLDQTRFQTDISYDVIRGLKKKRSVGCLMHNLLSRNIFPDVKIVIASREHSVTELPEEVRPKLVIALTGFTQDDAEKLFCEVSGEIDEQTMQNIRQLDMIKIPVYNIFTAVVYKFCNKNVPKYVSGLLAKILEIFTKSNQMRGIDLRNIDILHKMMNLAYDGMKRKRFTFDEEVLQRYGLNLLDVCDIMRKIPKSNIHPGLLMEGDIILIFCHQTLQEFLAACYISKMKFDDFKSFTDANVMEWDSFRHWMVVIQYLCGITLNSEITFDKRIHEVADKTTKQEILRNALRERVARVAECLILHESNDDSLIRQVERIVIRTPLNSNSARAIASVMRRNESMKEIWLQHCGLTDELLQIIAQDMKSSRLRVDLLRLREDDWNVSCETLNSFLSKLEVEQLVMLAFPTDFHEEFPIFQNVRILKMYHDVTVTNERHRVLFEGDKFSGEFDKKEKLLKVDIKDGYLNVAVRVQNICVAEKVQITAKDRCEARLKDLRAMNDPKWKVAGKNMDLEVQIDNTELNVLVTGCSDIREAANRWAVKSLQLEFIVGSQEIREFLQVFEDRIGDTKIHHLIIRHYSSYIFSDDDFKITSSIVTLCQVEHLQFENATLSMGMKKSERLKFILRNCKLNILECYSSFPIDEFNEIQNAAKVVGTKLQGIELSQTHAHQPYQLAFDSTTTYQPYQPYHQTLIQPHRPMVDFPTARQPYQPKFNFPYNLPALSPEVRPLYHLPSSSTNVRFPNDSPTSSMDIRLPYHLPISTANVQLPCDSPISSIDIRPPYHLPISSTNDRLPHHLSTSSTGVLLPYHAPTSLANVRFPYNLPTSSMNDRLPYDLPLSSADVRFPCRLPALPTTIDLTLEDDYEQDYINEGNDDDSNDK